MKQLTITLYVQPDNAVRAGKSSVGEHQLVLSDEDLARLTPEQRDTLARHVAGERHQSDSLDWADPLGMCGHGAWLPITEATIDSLATVLDDRRSRILAARAKQAECDQRYAALVSLLTARAKNCPVEDLVYSVSEPDWRAKGLRGLRIDTDPEWPDMRRPDDAAHSVAGRTDEVLTYVAKRQQELRAAREAAEAEKAARIAVNRATVKEILAAHAPDLIPVWEAGRADPKEVDRALRTHLRALMAERLGRPFGKVSIDGGGAVYCDTYSGPLTPEEFRSLEEVRAAAAQLAYPTEVEIVQTHSERENEEDEDEPDVLDGPRAVRVTARIADREIKASSPI
jgi:hypothetical protein